ncbi:hypothetical protein [Rothia sp. CCM 9419]|uniref:hypothetical protein n=1 Tax=Rothia sp. CCM 9419 TaxID=3402662 RepID=UPI003ADDD0DD
MTHTSLDCSSSERTEQLLRAWCTALTSTSVGALAHGIAGGGLPHPIIWLLCTALTALACLPFSTYRISKYLLAGAILLGQGLLHLMLAYSGTSLTDTHRHHHGAQRLNFSLHLETTTHHAHHGNMPLMVLFHIGAAAITFGMFCYGQETIRRCLNALSLRLTELFWTPPVHIHLPRTYRVPIYFFEQTLHTLLLLLTQPRRGPPLLRCSFHN